MVRLRVEVVYVSLAVQDVVAVEIESGATVLDAFNASGLAGRHVSIAGVEPVLGVFGKLVPLQRPVQEGDRVEVYRPLQADPKESRRSRASRKRRAGR